MSEVSNKVPKVIIDQSKWVKADSGDMPEMGWRVLCIHKKDKAFKEAMKYPWDIPLSVFYFVAEVEFDGLRNVYTGEIEDEFECWYNYNILNYPVRFIYPKQPKKDDFWEDIKDEEQDDPFANPAPKTEAIKSPTDFGESDIIELFPVEEENK